MNPEQHIALRRIRRRRNAIALIQELLPRAEHFCFYNARRELEQEGVIPSQEERIRLQQEWDDQNVNPSNRWHNMIEDQYQFLKANDPLELPDEEEHERWGRLRDEAEFQLIAEGLIPNLDEQRRIMREYRDQDSPEDNFLRIIHARAHELFRARNH